MERAGERRRRIGLHAESRWQEPAGRRAELRRCRPGGGPARAGRETIKPVSESVLIVTAPAKSISNLRPSDGRDPAQCNRRATTVGPVPTPIGLRHRVGPRRPSPRRLETRRDPGPFARRAIDDSAHGTRFEHAMRTTTPGDGRKRVVVTKWPHRTEAFEYDRVVRRSHGKTLPR
jgi:hypothetical protein